jgi:hypothetical protein
MYAAGLYAQQGPIQPRSGRNSSSPGRKPGARSKQSEPPRGGTALFAPAQIGPLSRVGMQFPETSYITAPDLSSPIVAGVYEILNSSGARWNLVPNAFMGPASFGTTEVIFVLH